MRGLRQGAPPPSGGPLLRPGGVHRVGRRGSLRHRANRHRSGGGRPGPGPPEPSATARRRSSGRGGPGKSFWPARATSASPWARIWAATPWSMSVSRRIPWKSSDPTSAGGAPMSSSSWPGPRRPVCRPFSPPGGEAGSYWRVRLRRAASCRSTPSSSRWSRRNMGSPIGPHFPYGS